MLDLLEYVVARFEHRPDPDRLPGTARPARDETVAGPPSRTRAWSRSSRSTTPRRRASSTSSCASTICRPGCANGCSFRPRATRSSWSRCSRCWPTIRDAGAEAVPATLTALLAARIDRLEPAERTVLQRASVEGRLFHRGSVAELVRHRRRVRSRIDPARARAERVRPPRPLPVRRRRRLSLQPRPDPRRRVLVHSEGASSRPPRASCVVARRPHRRARSGR